MAVATENALGTIVLAGDLAGGSNPTAPQLSPTGVVPGEYKGVSLVVDAKGRTVFARELSTVDLGCATKESCGAVAIGHNIVSQTIEDRTEISLAIASADTYGVVKLGDGISKDCCEIYVEVPPATTTTVGQVSVPLNSGLVVDNGALSAATATSSVKGIIKVPSADGLSIDAGVVTFVVDDTVLPATTTSKGFVRPNDTALSVTNGVLNLDGSAVTTFPIGSGATKGVVEIGSNLSVSSGLVSIPTATPSTIGVFRGDSTFTHTGGVLAAPKATSTDLGLVKVGAGLSVDGTGSVSRGAGSASTSAKGFLQIDPAGYINVSAGVLSTPTATTSTFGVFRGDASFSYTDGTMSYSSVASSGTPGFVTVGSGLTVDGSGILRREGFNVAATASSPGMVIISTSSGLTVTSGLIGIRDASVSQPGKVQIGTGINIDGNGVISIPNASNTVFGKVAGGTDFAISNGEINAPVGGMQWVDNSSTTAFRFNGLTTLASTTQTIDGTFSLNTTKQVYYVDLTTASTWSTPSGLIAGTVYLIYLSPGSPGADRTITFSSGWKFPADLAVGNVVTLPTGGNNAARLIKCVATSSTTITCFSIE